MLKVLGALLLAGIIILSQRAYAGQYYMYRDDQGVVHFIEDPGLAPSKYRHRVSPVKAEVVREEGPGAFKEETTLEELHRRAVQWWEGLGEEANPQEELQGRHLGGLIMYTLRGTWLFYALIGEALTLACFILGLWYAQDYPTQRERRRYTILLVVAYAILFLTSANYLVRPQLKNFFAQAAANADLILESGGLGEADRAAMTGFRETARTWANRIP